MLFQHTAARRRLLSVVLLGLNNPISFNTQPPEGGCVLEPVIVSIPFIVSTHSRPKAAAGGKIQLAQFNQRFNTQPPEGGCLLVTERLTSTPQFQHTAARRRLRKYYDGNYDRYFVSTHSRPKAAAPYLKKQEKSVH